MQYPLMTIRLIKKGETMKKYTVIYGEDYIAINRGKQEALYWHESEWKFDTQVVFSICHAIQLAERGKLENFLTQKLARTGGKRK